MDFINVKYSRCTCSLKCYTAFTPDEMVERRLQMQELSKGNHSLDIIKNVSAKRIFHVYNVNIFSFLFKLTSYFFRGERPAPTWCNQYCH